MLVEEYHSVGDLQLLENQFALGRLLLFFREALGVAQFGMVTISKGI